MSKGKLTDVVRTFIVQQLACYDSPSTVAKAVKDEFGIEITRQTAETYDPTKQIAKGHLARKWKVLFEETRRAFLEDTSRIGIANRAVRLRALERVAKKAEEQGNHRIVMDANKQAAEEMGGVYTNRREFSGPGGKPLAVTAVTAEMTPQQAADAYADAIRGDA